MEKEIQIKYLRKAYEQGRRDAEMDSYCSWWTPRLEMAYRLGHKGIGVDFDKAVRGYRYGACPRHASRNYATDTLEAGVSLAALEGEKEAGSSIWFADREKERAEGLLIEERGSDGEPLIIPLDMDEQYDY